MKSYEGMFLVDNRKANRDWDAVAEHVRGILEKCNASVQSLSNWGERRLAYPIEKHTRGVYILTYFEVPEENTQAVSEIYRQVDISDTILRGLILRAKQVPEQIATEAVQQEEPGTASAGDEQPRQEPTEPAEETAEKPAPQEAPPEQGVDASPQGIEEESSEA